MHSKESILSKKTIIFVILIFLGITVAVAFGYKAATEKPQAVAVTEITQPLETAEEENNVSKVVLRVKDMSCSGCISTIKASLADIQGIKDIIVDVAGGKAEVYYESNELKDVSQIARAITDSGYPAGVQRIMTPEEIKKERDLAAAKSRYYIASVDGWDIARADFETEMEVARKRYLKAYGDNIFETARGKALVDNLKAQAVSRLIDEGILMQEIAKSGFEVNAETVDRELEEFYRKMGRTPAEFRKSLTDAGYDFAYFQKKFEMKVLLDKYLDERVLAGASSQYQRQNLFSSWFNNSKALAEVVYYDKDLERIVLNRSSSGSCCPVG